MKNHFICISFFLSLLGCSPRVAVDKTQSIHFQQYQTYGWMDSDVNAMYSASSTTSNNEKSN
jgi:hypothetical protein